MKLQYLLVSEWYFVYAIIRDVNIERADERLDFAYNLMPVSCSINAALISIDTHNKNLCNLLFGRCIKHPRVRAVHPLLITSGREWAFTQSMRFVCSTRCIACNVNVSLPLYLSIFIFSNAGAPSAPENYNKMRYNQIKLRELILSPTSSFYTVWKLLDIKIYTYIYYYAKINTL